VPEPQAPSDAEEPAPPEPSDEGVLASFVEQWQARLAEEGEVACTRDNLCWETTELIISSDGLGLNIVKRFSRIVEEDERDWILPILQAGWEVHQKVCAEPILTILEKHERPVEIDYRTRDGQPYYGGTISFAECEAYFEMQAEQEGDEISDLPY